MGKSVMSIKGADVVQLVKLPLGTLAFLRCVDSRSTALFPNPHSASLSLKATGDGQSTPAFHSRWSSMFLRLAWPSQSLEDIQGVKQHSLSLLLSP